MTSINILQEAAAMAAKAGMPHSPNLTIPVEQKTIDSAQIANSNHCMIADAIKLKAPHATHVAVDIQTIRFTDPARKLRYVYLTPRSVQEAIIRFDHGEKMKPFKFRLGNAHVVASGYKPAHGGTDARAMPMKGKKTEAKKTDAKKAASVPSQESKTGAGKIEGAAPQLSAKKAAHVSIARGASQVVNAHGNSNAGNMPHRVGGRTPPRAVGARREFGLRAFG